MEIKVRNATEKDLPQLIILADEIRDHHIKVLGGYFKPQNDEIEGGVILRHITEPEDNFALVAVNENNTVLGFLLAEKRPAPWLLLSDIVNISNIGVFEKYRGHGIAGLIMDEFVEVCKSRGIKEIKLGVYNANEVAYNFYLKYGFAEQEQRMSFKL